MHFYAQIDEKGIVSGVSQLASKMDIPELIPIKSLDFSLMGKVWDGRNFNDNPDAPKFVSAAGFINRFSLAEMAAIHEAAKADSLVSAWLEMTRMAESIDLKASRTSEGIQALAEKGLIAPERIGEILS